MAATTAALGRSLLSRVQGRDEISKDLQAELGREPTWSYPWRLAPGVSARTAGRRKAITLHETRRTMVEQPVRDALALAGRKATAINVACDEGWFSHLLLEWGAEHVLALDSSEVKIRRARMIADHFGIADDRLEPHQANAVAPRPEDVGQFDVVVAFGVLHHFDNFTTILRRFRSLCKRLCVIEEESTGNPEGPGYVTRWRVAAQGDGIAGFLDGEGTAGSRVLRTGWDGTALAEKAKAAGFSRAEIVRPPVLGDTRMVRGDSNIILAWS